MNNFFTNEKVLKKIYETIGANKNVFVHGICDGGKPCFISSIDIKNKIVVVLDEIKANNFLNEYKFFDDRVYYYKENDIIFNLNAEDRNNLYQSRMEVIEKMISGEPTTIVFTISSFFEKVEKYDKYKKNILYIKKNDNQSFDEFINKVNQIGYRRVNTVENYGEYSIRGSIVDIFDSKYDNPIRIDFFDEEIDSIRFFNINTMITIEEINEIKIMPFDADIKDRTESIFSFFDEDYVIFIDEYDKLIDRAQYLLDIAKDYNEYEIENEEEKKDTVKDNLFDLDYVLSVFDNYKKIYISTFDQLKKEKKMFLEVEFNITTPILNKKNYAEIKKEIKNMLDSGYSGILVIESNIKAQRIYEEFVEDKINTSIITIDKYKRNEGQIDIVIGNIKSGFIDSENKGFLFSEYDVFDIKNENRKKVRYKKNDNYEIIDSIEDLEVGDYVVHENFGVGIYEGLIQIKTDDISKDYIKIRYADQSHLYVLVSKLEVVEKYASGNALPPKLNSLKSNDFIKIKNKLKDDIMDVARDLISLYAKRSSREGFKYSKDTIWQREFEETFPYIETDDQLTAIEQVKSDMESDKIMDRLICGDVGFGKTEVAIRAAFKAVQDNKQVVMLAPTTILVDQHYKTFINRFKTYPVNVEYMSRFKTKAENKEVIEKLKTGEVDIVIGTHRLLSKDIEFKDLGLLIIDEEQRFGVTHKEKIHKLKNNVDTLTLSATPIPRTLYMSLNNIRDMSLLTQAPPERVPIKTYVYKYSDELIRDAILREIKRDGQVFIVHNKVSDIYEFAKHIKEICSEAKVCVSHGQMEEDKLSKIIEQYINKEYNVLVTTTIIEIGIDIKNANTLIIDNAENFGLSQLYQLRGRVGRSDRVAYAFFLYNGNKKLTEGSDKRLKAIKEFSGLGSGIKVALRDLEIRGAGNILGLSQSGHVDMIGYSLYVKLLNEALKVLNKNKNMDEFINDYDTQVDIDIDAFIPNEYIDDVETKLSMYKKIASCKNEEDFKNVEYEFLDRFGKIPKEVSNLIYIARIKLKAHTLYIVDMNVKKNFFKIVFYEKAKINLSNAIDILNNKKLAYRVLPGREVSIVCNDSKNLFSVNENMDLINDILNELKKIN